MAVPKRRHTHSRAAKRRTHYKLRKGKGLIKVVKSKDGNYKMPHFIDPITGKKE